MWWEVRYMLTIFHFFFSIISSMWFQSVWYKFPLVCTGNFYVDGKTITFYIATIHLLNNYFMKSTIGELYIYPSSNIYLYELLIVEKKNDWITDCIKYQIIFLVDKNNMYRNVIFHPYCCHLLTALQECFERKKTGIQKQYWIIIGKIKNMDG